ncbi:uncharacterized protein LAESUDRAFT_732630 [Laetiporus sulphureus 93-53]|uniref:C2H2-type domain-containing protein n=1 Tax=Laetiporus sulphureus 93-53 TaxID=1314785 RepID=A0A165B1B4_9APHY|nr:uncharacterized protein LAESUDRAFT_732630 [Laetiporus sulphureus 93-53]KZT00041.1 hypothetical protein LAESUDRAFT_732630 [Laetiporus sulphureus 93-53]
MATLPPLSLPYWTRPPPYATASSNPHKLSAAFALPSISICYPRMSQSPMKDEKESGLCEPPFLPSPSHSLKPLADYSSDDDTLLYPDSDKESGTNMEEADSSAVSEVEAANPGAWLNNGYWRVKQPRTCPQDESHIPGSSGRQEQDDERRSQNLLLLRQTVSLYDSDDGESEIDTEDADYSAIERDSTASSTSPHEYRCGPYYGSSTHTSRKTPSAPAPYSLSLPVRSRRSSSARNSQVHITQQEFDEMLTKFAASRSLECPLGCGYSQRETRVPDMRRHLNTHRASESYAKWVCCGVPLKDAFLYDVCNPDDWYMFRDTKMVGGCMKSFSRRDALVRHVHNSRAGCVAEPDLLHLLGN